MGDKLKRYPSIRAFQKREANLFIGREQETKLLFNKVVSEKMILLFARSGIGKSSLINAGLAPMLEERGYLPIDIRLSTSDDPADTPLDIFKKLLEHYLNRQQYDELVTELRTTFPEYEPGLWEYFKCCAFPLATTPVLIFDQFEQYFSFTVKQQDDFMLEINDLLADLPPSRFTELLHDTASLPLREKYLPYLTQPDLHILFAIRSDKIFEMNRLSQLVPNILRNRFELYPLKETDAKKAICLPAAVKNEVLYKSNPFQYDPQLINNIIARLKGGNDIIETTQLQIICSEIETRIILNADGEPDKPEDYTVTEDDLKIIGGIENIVAHFYQNQVSKMGNEKYQELARILIEDNLFDKDTRNRKLSFKDAVINILNNGKETLGIPEADNEAFINKLLGLRLIREDYRENKKFYEISHDYLLNAITESFEVREAKRLAEANAALAENNRMLVDLKEKAELATAEAKKQEENAVTARERAIKNYELAITERKKVEKLKKRNDRMALALAIAGLATLIYLMIQIDSINRNKRKFKNISERATRALNRIYLTEAEKRYAAGDHMVAYALWDSARSYNDQDTMISHKLNTLPFAPFAGSNVQVSKDKNYIGVLLGDNRFTLWKEDTAYNTLKEVITVPDYLGFRLLDDGKVVLMDTSHRAFTFDPVKDIKPMQLLPDSLKVSFIRKIEGTNVIILSEYGKPGYFCYSTVNFEPLTAVNAMLRKINARARDNQTIFATDFCGIDSNNFLISANGQALYHASVNSSVPPMRLRVKSYVEFVTANTGRLFPFNEDKSLKVLDPLTGAITETGIPLEESDYPVQFICGDSVVFVSQSTRNSLYNSTGFSLYNIRQKRRIFQRSNCYDVYYDINMKAVAFITESDRKPVVFDVVLEKVTYPPAGFSYPGKVLTAKTFGRQGKIFIQHEDKSIYILPYNSGQPGVLTPVSYFPDELYGSRLYKGFDPKYKMELLFYQDSAKNNIDNIRRLFKRYTDREIRSVLGD